MSRNHSPSGRGRLSSQFAAAATLFVALASCGGSSEGTPGAAKPIAIEDFAKALADAVCGNVGPCCGNAGYPFDSNACHAKSREQIGTFVRESNVEGTVYDADAAGQCAAEYASVARACGDTQSVDATCRKVFRGTRMAGESCSSNVQCESGECGLENGQAKCDGKSDRVHRMKGESCEGTCTVNDDKSEYCRGPIPPGGGDPFERRGCYTNDGLICGPDFICHTAPAFGEACFVGFPCAGDSFCEAGTCARKRATGSCGEASDACDSSAFCDLTSRECRAKKSDGEACSSSGECKSPSLCLSQDGPSSGTCGRPSIVNEQVCLGK